MPNKLASAKINRLVSLTAMVALVIQTIVPGGLFSWPANRALAASQDWDFTSASDYTVGEKLTVMDGNAVVDLRFTLSTGGVLPVTIKSVTDLIETSGSENILMAMNEPDVFPYSTDSGSTWGVSGATKPDLSNTHYKFTKYTSGPYSGRIVAAGYNTTDDVNGDAATWYTTNEGISWTATNKLGNTTRGTAIEAFGNTLLLGTSGSAANDNTIVANKTGGDGEWLAADYLGGVAGVTRVNDFAVDSAGTGVIVGLTADAPGSGKVNIMYSSDGLSWTRSGTVSGNSSVTGILSFAVAPNGDIFATTNGNYILKSTDDGVTWSEIAVSNSANAKIIYVDSKGGIVVIKGTSVWRSLDGGTDFAAQTNSVPDSISAAEGFIRTVGDHYLLGATDSGGTGGDVYKGHYTAAAEVTAESKYTISNNTGVAFTSISAVTDSYSSISEGTAIGYHFRAINSGDWYYWDGSQWSVSNSEKQVTHIDELTQSDWNRFLSDLGLTSGTFYFQAVLTDPATMYKADGYNSIVLDKVSLTYVNNTDTGGDIPPDDKRVEDKEPPISAVVGILENGALKPMPANIYTSDFVVVAKATDNLQVNSVTLFWSKSQSGDYQNWGTGVPDSPLPGYWSWYFDTNGADGDGTYYFYSIAMDWATPANAELLPKYSGWQYDATTTVVTDYPYIQYTYPAEGTTKVGVLEKIVVKFSRDMDRASVESAFSILSSNNSGTDLGWSFEWRKMGPGGWGAVQNRSVIISHSAAFNYSTMYTAFINPFIAKDINGMALSQTSPSESGAYNPWHFMTDMPQKPDLSNSTKSAFIYDEQDPALLKDHAEPGDYLLYSIFIQNTDGKTANPTTLLDNIPAHTKYVTGSLQVKVQGSDLWVQMVAPPKETSQFEAWYEESADGVDGNGRIKGTGSLALSYPVEIRFMVKLDKPIANGTLITNTAEINDGTNPTHYKSATVVIESSSNWSEKSYKEAKNENANRTPGTAKVGDILTYTIYLENSGNMDADQVEVIDRVPSYTSLIGAPTGGLIYDPLTNKLNWIGSIKAGQNQTFTFQASVTGQPANDLITNTTTISDASGEYALVREITVIPDPPGTPPYIVSPTQPKGGDTSVKLFSPIVITFSDGIKPETLSYTVSRNSTVIYNSTSKTWSETWSANSDGVKNAKVTIQPTKPWQTGGFYTVRVLDAIGVNEQHLAKNGDVPNNTWSFTAARPALYFTDQSILSFKAGTVSQQITVKLGDWINFNDAAAGGQRQYSDYVVENSDGISINLLSTSETGRFDTDPEGKFDGSVISVPMAEGQDTVTFYYTDSVVTYPTFYTLIPYVSTSAAGYLVYSEERLVITTTGGEEATSDQIYFRTGQQTVPAGELSEAIQFEIRNPKGELVDIKAGRQFLLESTSQTGTFYNEFQLPISQYVMLQGENETKTYYVLTMTHDTTRATFYYMDTEPGTYNVMIHDKDIKVAAEATGPANSGSQTLTIAPIDDQELEEEVVEELEEVKDETNRKLDQIKIEPVKTTVLPGGARTFKAAGYDTDGKEIKELKFSWYIIGGGGTILKKGLTKDNHSSTFTAGKIPGVYSDTVLVAAMYNGEIQAATASVTIMDVVNYGGPDELPSTGPNGIQLLFIVLTLLAAVALAAVEHYEKTHFYEGAGSAK